MKLLYKGEEIEFVITNRSISLEEALYVNGYDVNDEEDLKKAYEDGKPWTYINDESHYDWDFEHLELVW